MHITPVQYAVEARRLEKIQNEAFARHDASALKDTAVHVADLNRVFWGRELKRAA